MHNEVDKHLKGPYTGSVAFTVSGSTATITGNLTRAQLQALLDGCSQAKHDVKVTAGVITVFPA